jgi:hypothetical protein
MGTISNTVKEKCSFIPTQWMPSIPHSHPLNLGQPRKTMTIALMPWTCRSNGHLGSRAAPMVTHHLHQKSFKEIHPGSQSIRFLATHRSNSHPSPPPLAILFIFGEFLSVQALPVCSTLKSSMQHLKPQVNKQVKIRGGDQLREGLPCRSGVETASPWRSVLLGEEESSSAPSSMGSGPRRSFVEVVEQGGSSGPLSVRSVAPLISPRHPQVRFTFRPSVVLFWKDLPASSVGLVGQACRPMSRVPIHKPKPALKKRPYDWLRWLEDSIWGNSPCQHQNLSCPSQLLQCTQGHGAQEKPTQQQWQVVRKKRWWRREKKGINAQYLTGSPL